MRLKLVGLCWLSAASLQAGVPAALQMMADGAQQSLVRLDKSVADAAEDAAPFVTASNDRMLRAILQRVVRSNQMAVDAALVSPAGRMRLIDPPEYKKFERTDISTQAAWKALAQSNRPVLSQAFRMAEGFYAVSLAHPVTANGIRSGAVSVAFNPSGWIEGTRRGPLSDLPFRFFAVQKDGLILAGSDPGFVGANLLKEASGAPAAMQALARRILTEPSGDGVYTRPAADDEMRTRVSWTTVGLRGTEFRLALTSDFAGAVPRGSVNADTVARALDRLADSPSLVKALRGKTGEAEDAMLAFLQQTRGVYTVQLLDVRGKVICGQPVQAVPSGMHTGAVVRPGGSELGQAIAGKNPTRFEGPLLEGGNGLFLVQPLPRGIGSLLAIVRYE